MYSGKILLVGACPGFTETVKARLEASGYVTKWVSCGEKAEENIRREWFDMILLEEHLPDGNSTKWCRRFRIDTLIPLMVLFAKEDTKEILKALHHGADDYMVRPLDISVLLAKVRANVRRSHVYDRGSRPKQMKYYRRFAIDFSQHSVWKRGENGGISDKVHLSPTEYSLLVVLLHHERELLSYEELYQAVWKADDLGDVRTVMVHVSNLRKKLDPRGNDMIRTVRGHGYFFRDV